MYHESEDDIRQAFEEGCDFVYGKDGYNCVWTPDSLEDNFCRVDREQFTNKTNGLTFRIAEIRNPRLRWVEFAGGLFKSRKAGYQITAQCGDWLPRIVLLDTTDKIPRRCDTANAQAICSGEKNILKVALASLLLAQAGDDIRRTYLEVFDQYGHDTFDSFPWPDGVLE